MSPRPLKLLARDAADLDVVSACLQDAVAQIGDMAYDAGERRFVLIANRYCWEYDKAPMRVRSALQIRGVTAVQQHKLNRSRADAVVSLLVLRFEAAAEAPAGVVRLVMSGGGEIRLEVEACEAILEDVSAPWSGRAQPQHDLES